MTSPRSQSWFKGTAGSDSSLSTATFQLRHCCHRSKPGIGAPRPTTRPLADARVRTTEMLHTGGGLQRSGTRTLLAGHPPRLPRSQNSHRRPQGLALRPQEPEGPVSFLWASR